MNFSESFVYFSREADFGEDMSVLRPQDHIGGRHDEIDLPLSKHGAFGVAMVWLAFYALIVVRAIVSHFH